MSIENGKDQAYRLVSEVSLIEAQTDYFRVATRFIGTAQRFLEVCIDLLTWFHALFYVVLLVGVVLGGLALFDRWFGVK